MQYFQLRLLLFYVLKIILINPLVVLRPWVHIMLSVLLLALLSGGLVYGAFSTEGEVLPKAETTLKAVFMVCGPSFSLGVHGIRSPMRGPFFIDTGYLKYPTGQIYLTEMGKLMMKHVGRSLRSRYSSFLRDNTDAQSRLVTAFPTGLVMDSAEILSDNLFEGRYIPKVLTEVSVVFDKTGSVYRSSEDSDCSKYTCLRDLEQKRTVINSENQKLFFKEFSKGVFKQIETPEMFYPLYDRLFMQKLNGDFVPSWFSALNQPRVDYNRKLRMKKFIGYTKDTFKFITDPLVRWIVNILGLKEPQSLYDSLIVEARGFARKVQVHVTEDILVSVLGWVLFSKSYEDAFLRQFVVDMGDVLLLEVHDITKSNGAIKEILKVFYYRPLAEDPGRRFKELSLESFIQSQGLLNQNVFHTELLSSLAFKAPYYQECFLPTKQQSKLPWRKNGQECN